MSDYRLATGVYLSPTPLGAYYAVGSTEEEPARAVILELMNEDRAPEATAEALRAWSGQDDPLGLVFRMQSVRWLEGRSAPLELRVHTIENDVPELLAALSDEGRALLADTQGFHLAQAGFSHELAEDLGLLAAEMAQIQRKHAALIHGNLRLASPAMGVVDGGGSSQLGFWPIYLGSHDFVLVVAGMPRFDRPEYLQLVWALCRRYRA